MSLHVAIENPTEINSKGRISERIDQIETAKTLIKHNKKSVCEQNAYGCIAQHLAAKTRNFEILKAAYEAEPKQANAKNLDGDTALHVAARLDRRNIVRILLNKNANTTVTNRRNETSLNVAIGSSERDLGGYNR